MRCIVYTSRTSHNWTPPELRSLADEASRQNDSIAVTGLLLFLGQRFIQVLEGPAEPLGKLMSGIAADPRHYGLQVLLDTVIVTRTFPGWGMDLAVGETITETEINRQLALMSRAELAASLDAFMAAHGSALLGGINTSFVNRALRVTPNQQRALATTQQLLDAAQRVALRLGMEQATMRAIADEAGVGLKAAYRYFSSPTDMFRLLVRQRQSRKFEAFRAWLRSARFASPGDLARQIATYTASDYMVDPKVPAAALRIILREFHDIAFSELHDLASSVIAAMAREGFAVDDPNLHSRIAMAFGAIGGAAKMAGLHDPGQLRGAYFVEMVSGLLQAAFSGDGGYSETLGPPARHRLT